MEIEYKTKGTCSSRVFATVENGIVKNVRFVGGCEGNHKGISALIEGMETADVVKRLRGIDCKMKGTSCPDQLAAALAQSTQEQAEKDC